jgi:glycosyltransferase involved in cell wall biosynthesis
MKSEPFCRVLHVIFRPQRRGAELVAIQLAAAMSERVESAICSLFCSKLDIPVDVDYRLDIAPGLMTRIFGFNWHVFWKLLKIAREYRPQIIIAHGGDTFRYVSLLKFTRRTRAYAIYKCTGYPLETSLNFKGYISRFLLQPFDTIVCIGKICQRQFIRHYHLTSDKVISIEEGIDQSSFASLDRARKRLEIRKTLGIQPEELILINVGGLSPVKNQMELISLVAALHETGIPVHQLIAGAGELKGALEEDIRRVGLQHFVHLLGERDDVLSLLAASDLFVLSSRTEGMPLVLMEAGLARLPSVAYNVGGISDVIEDGRTGLLVPFGDFQKLVEAVSALCWDPARRKIMGEAAYQKCRDSFDIRTISRQYEEMFHKLLTN